MLILGLTGGIATGKSSVSKIFEEKYKLPIIDADKIAREVVEPGNKAYDQIIKHFNPLIDNLVNDDKSLNRGALGSYVFSHRDELKVLNSISHPAIRRRILYLIWKEYINGSSVVILDIPLLFESGMDWLCSRVLTISCNSQNQLERLLKRNKELTEDEAINRINSQMKIIDKVKKSDYFIDNDSSFEELENSVEKFVKLNLPAIKVTNNNNNYSYMINSWWNYFQAIFPPFAILGIFNATIRKSILKLKLRLTKTSLE